MVELKLEVLGVHVDRAMPLFHRALAEGRLTPGDLLRDFGFLPPVAGGTGGYSAYAEAKIIDHSCGKATWTTPAVVTLALCTVLPTVSSTGSTITEANYTGYARASITTSVGTTVMGSASGSNPASNSNGSTVTFAACTALSSTIVGWALVDSATTGAGNIIMFGSCASTVVSTTQTPATVASGALTMSLT